MNQRIVLYVLLMFVAAQTGCATRLPTYPWVDRAHALQLLAERSSQLRTLSSPCRIVLADANTGPTQLDGAIVARSPGFLRLRAWKFSQPVLDITLTPDGLWLFSSQRDEPSAGHSAPFASLTAQQLRQAWSLVTGGMPLDDWTWNEDTARAVLTIRQGWESGGSIDCTLDRDTLTLRRCTVRRSSKAAELQLTLDRYRAIQAIAVPTRVTMRSDHGAITILLDEPSLNEELSPAAFDPPRRAVKQP